MDLDELLTSSRPFLAWLVDWHNSRPALPWTELLEGPEGDPARTAVFAVDVTSGFCSEGPLSSERVGSIVEPITRLFRQAYTRGVRYFILPQDTHTEDAIEFGSFPAHCVRGTSEPRTVTELRNLSFSHLFQVIEKNSLSSSIDTELDVWLDDHPQVTTFLVVSTARISACTSWPCICA